MGRSLVRLGSADLPLGRGGVEIWSKASVGRSLVRLGSADLLRAWSDSSSRTVAAQRLVGPPSRGGPACRPRGRRNLFEGFLGAKFGPPRLGGPTVSARTFVEASSGEAWSASARRTYCESGPPLHLELRPLRSDEVVPDVVLLSKLATKVSSLQIPRTRQRIGLEELEQHVRHFPPAALAGMSAVAGQVFAFPRQAVGFAGRGAVSPEVWAP